MKYNLINDYKILNFKCNLLHHFLLPTSKFTNKMREKNGKRYVIETTGVQPQHTVDHRQLSISKIGFNSAEPKKQG